jgi:peptide deformylase
MAILKIARMGHPVLATPAQAVRDPKSPEIRRLVNDMVETVMDANGAGLAAPQVHVSLRVVVFQAPDERADPEMVQEERFDHTAPLTVLINPEIEVLDLSPEGGWVERPAHIRYRGMGLDGEMIERVARGFHARVVQHECDHLDGRLYTSRLNDLSRLIFESEIRHFQVAG